MIALIPALCWAGLPVYYTQVSASDANTTVTVSLSAFSNQALTVTVANDGSNEVFVNTNGSTATTANLKILAGEIHKFTADAGMGITTIGIICSAGETSTVRVFAFPK